MTYERASVGCSFILFWVTRAPAQHSLHQQSLWDIMVWKQTKDEDEISICWQKIPLFCRLLTGTQVNHGAVSETKISHCSDFSFARAFFIIHQPPLLSSSCLALYVILPDDKALTTAQHNASFCRSFIPTNNNKYTTRNDDNRILIRRHSRKMQMTANDATEGRKAKLVPINLPPCSLIHPKNLSRHNHFARLERPSSMCWRKNWFH